MHAGSLDTFETLRDGSDGLERYSFTGDFGQYILNGVKGDILEIGVGESSYFLSRIAEKYDRRIWHCDIAASKIINPMSVPGFLTKSEDLTFVTEDEEFENLKRAVAYAGPSDKLFQKFAIETIALAFIDGDHNYKQARRDFYSVWDRLVENGVVMLHDTYPPDQSWTDENKCGDVYKLRQELENSLENADVFTVPRGTCIGVGVTIVRKRETQRNKIETEWSDNEKNAQEQAQK